MKKKKIGDLTVRNLIKIAKNCIYSDGTIKACQNCCLYQAKDIDCGKYCIDKFLLDYSEEELNQEIEVEE